MQGNSGFKPLSEVHANEVVSVYGRVLTCKPVRRTRGTDHSMTLFISDGSLAGDVSVNIFRPNITDFPPLSSETGSSGTLEVVQLRRFKAQSYGGNVQLLSCQWSGWTVFYKDDLGRWRIRSPSWQNQPQNDILAEVKEIEILDHLITATENRKRENDKSDRPTNATATATSATSSSRPLLTVQDLAPNIYFDLNCRVVKVLNVREDDGQLFTALVTDYTENSAVHFESSEFEDIPSYLRNALLHVTIWDNFVPVARQVMHEGVFLVLRNLHARTNNLDGSLVAVLHGDPRCSRPHHFISADDALSNVLLRRREAMERMEELRANQIPQMSLTRLIKEPAKLAWSRIIDIQQSAGHTRIFKTRAIVKSVQNSKLLQAGKDMLKLTLQDSTGELTVALVGERLRSFIRGGDLSKLTRSLLPSEFCLFSYLNSHGHCKYQIFNTCLCSHD